MKRIDVAVGIIYDQQGRVLVGQRLVKDRYFQKWEFPGGKLAKEEQPEVALKRELMEELAIQVTNITPLITLEHDYPDRLVRLHAFEVNDFSGEPIGYEGQQIQWVYPQQCVQLDFLAANESIVNAIRLPENILITDFNRFGIERTLNYIAKFSTDDLLIQLREPDATIEQLANYLHRLRSVKERSIIILNGLPEQAVELGFDGVQLNHYIARNYHQRTELPDFWIGISCHNQQELSLAEKIGDFALLSPIQVTRSHPDKAALGWNGFAELVKGINIPCYALGGIKPKDVNKIRTMGGQGMAAISTYFQP